MKKVISIIIALVLLVSVAGCGSSTGKSNTESSAPASSSESVALTAKVNEPMDLTVVLYQFNQTVADNNDAIWAAINEKLKAGLNTTLTPKYVTSDAYPLLVASNDAFDIVWTADWVSYWQYAQSEAFIEITDDMLASSKPESFELKKDFKDVGKLNGKRYMIPTQDLATYNWLWIVRGDLMKKYNVPDIKNLEGFGVYLDAIAKNEKGMIPFDINSGNAWVIPSVLVNEARWVAPGQVNCASPFFARLDDPQGKLFYALDAPETVQFSKMMNEWQKKGYWSKTALSSKVSLIDSFKAGTSGAAWDSGFDTLYALSEDPQFKDWDIKGYPMYQYGFSGSRANQGISIYNRCKDPQRALDVINLLVNNKELNLLTVYGQEGVNYTIDTDGSFIVKTSGKDSGIYAVINPDYKIPTKSGIKFSPLESFYKNSYVPSVVTDFVLDNQEVKDVQAKLNDIYSQYFVVRNMGFADDVEKAIAEEKQQQMAAGVEKYIEVVQKQLDAYLASLK